MKKMKSKERRTLSIEEEYSVGNSIQFTEMEKNVLRVEIDNPWSGDTESGFGRTAHINLSRDGAEELLAFLTEWLSYE